MATALSVFLRRSAAGKMKSNEGAQNVTSETPREHRSAWRILGLSFFAVVLIGMLAFLVFSLAQR
jgi:disulfide bond formation protein DsbB